MARPAREPTIPDEFTRASEVLPTLKAALADTSIDYDYPYLTDPPATRHVGGRVQTAADILDRAIRRLAAKKTRGVHEDILLLQKLAACRHIPENFRDPPRVLVKLLAEVGFHHTATFKWRNEKMDVYVRTMDGRIGLAQAREMLAEARHDWKMGPPPRKKRPVEKEIRDSLVEAVRKVRGVQRSGAEVEVGFASPADAARFLKAFEVFMRVTAGRKDE